MHRIVCLGDSITHAFSCPEGRRWTATLQAHLDEAAPGAFEVYNRGIGGNTSAQGLERFPTEVLPLKPTIVLIEFGFNDASVPEPRHIPRCSLPAFQENLLEIIRMTRDCGAEPVLLVNHPICAAQAAVPQGNGKFYVDNFRPYQPAIRAVAEAHGIAMIDLEKEMQSAGVEASHLVTEDGLHLTVDGNRIYGRFVFEGLQRLQKVPVA